jgi:cytochrome bd-type quinol oxidase subunit 2
VNDAIDLLQRRKTQVVAAAIGIHLIFGALAVSYFPAIVDQSAMQSAVEQLRGSMLNIGYQVATLVG